MWPKLGFTFVGAVAAWGLCDWLTIPATARAGFYVARLVFGKYEYEVRMLLPECCCRRNAAAAGMLLPPECCCCWLSQRLCFTKLSLIKLWRLKIDGCALVGGDGSSHLWCADRGRVELHRWGQWPNGSLPFAVPFNCSHTIARSPSYSFGWMAVAIYNFGWMAVALGIGLFIASTEFWH